MSILSDWAAFRESGASFPDGHFESLLISHSSKEELDAVFKGLPNGEAAAQRIVELIQRTKMGGFDYRVPATSSALSKTEAADVLVRIGGAIQDFLGEIGFDDLADKTAGLAVEFVEQTVIDAELNIMTNFEYEIYDAIGDAYLEMRFDEFQVHSALCPAVYRLTNSPYITRYLIDPIWKFGMDNQPFLDLYVGGYTHFFTQKALLAAKIV